MKKLIEIENLKTFFYTEAGTAKAVDGVSFDIFQGEVLGIVGESGSGKSVTSLSINRLIPNPPGDIVDGKIMFKGINLLDLSYDEMKDYRGKEIAMIFQEPMTSLNPVYKINLQMNEVLIEHEGLTWDEANLRSIDMLTAVGIPNPDKRMNDYPHQFSGGMRQRAMIAMALLCNPALLIADEPTTALDVTIQAQILDLMMSLKEKREDAAILLITHDLAVIAETCDRVIVMYGGKIQEVAGINELFANPVNPYTQALMESIPKLETKERRLKSLKGMVPSILEMGDGCKLCSRFEPEDCACKGTKEEPDLIKVSENHWARVHPGLLS
ncbi:ABC transporter ATP-binding protein [Candidatus Marinimicrobia bacterium PRS2]|jgi:oligopeptide/dipeptide ABC transporter ATP-binding protein|nr:ABC transporter ATP-binding protein [Candidatus Marinimicrobia bacterium PRS2]